MSTPLIFQQENAPTQGGGNKPLIFGGTPEPVIFNPQPTQQIQLQDNRSWLQKGVGAVTNLFKPTLVKPVQTVQPPLTLPGIAKNNLGPIQLDKSGNIVEPTVVPGAPANIGTETISAGKTPTSWDKVKEILSKPFKASDAELVARAGATVAVRDLFAKKNNIDPNQINLGVVQDNLDTYTKELGIRSTLNNKEFTELMFTLTMPATLAAEVPVIVLAKRIGKFALYSTAVDGVIATVTGKPMGEGLKSFLPENTATDVKDLVDILDLIGKAYLTHGMGKVEPRVADFLTKQKIIEYKLPRNISIDPATIKDIHQTGKMATPEQLSYLNDFQRDMSNRGVKFDWREAQKNGVEINIPSEKIVTITDKPYWAKIKAIIGLPKTEPISVTSYPEGKPAGSMTNNVKDTVTAQPETRQALSTEGSKVTEKPQTPTKPEESPVTPKSEKVSTPLEPLANEARKYGSAEEFVKAQDQYVYHNSSQRNIETIKEEGISNKYAGEYPHGLKDIPDTKPRIYLSEDPKRALSFGGSVDSKYPELKSALMRVKKSVLGGDTYSPKLDGGELWYFGEKIKPENIEIYEDGVWKSLTGKKAVSPTKSQLTDIYNQLTKKISDVTQLPKKPSIEGIVEPAVQESRGESNKIIADNENTIKKVYSDNKEMVYDALSQIFTEMEVAQAGSRVRMENGETVGFSSTFPAWVPETLRDKKLFDKVLSGIVSVDTMKFPEGNRTAQRSLYSEILSEIDRTTGLDTSANRDAILEAYGDFNTKEINQTAEPVSESVAGGQKPQPKVETPAKPVSVPKEQLPVGQGKEKVSRLAERMQESLKGFSEEDRAKLPTYNQMSKPEQNKLAAEYYLNNPEEAMKVLKGEVDPPNGILYNSIFNAARENASIVGDITLMRDLASLRSTRFGQEISILAEANPNDPVTLIRDVYKSRINALEKRIKGTVSDTVKKEVIKIKSKIPKVNKYDWDKFVESIEC